jgi:hypothetical protein
VRFGSPQCVALLSNGHASKASLQDSSQTQSALTHADLCTALDSCPLFIHIRRTKYAHLFEENNVINQNRFSNVDGRSADYEILQLLLEPQTNKNWSKEHVTGPYRPLSQLNPHSSRMHFSIITPYLPTTTNSTQLS